MGQETPTGGYGHEKGKPESTAFGPLIVLLAVFVISALLSGAINWAVFYLLALIMGFEPLGYWQAFMVGMILYAYKAIFNADRGAAFGKWLAVKWHLSQQGKRSERNG